MSNFELKPTQTASLRFIYLLVFIDMMGIGMIIPVVQPLIQSITGQAPTNIIFLNGILLASYSAASFLCAPLMGALSDKFGRRPVIPPKKGVIKSRSPQVLCLVQDA